MLAKLVVISPSYSEDTDLFYVYFKYDSSNLRICVQLCNKILSDSVNGDLQFWLREKT